MPGRVVSPKNTVNRPLLTATATSIVGSNPPVAELSLLQ